MNNIEDLSINSGKFTSNITSESKYQCRKLEIIFNKPFVVVEEKL